MNSPIFFFLFSIEKLYFIQNHVAPTKMNNNQLNIYIYFLLYLEIIIRVIANIYYYM